MNTLTPGQERFPVAHGACSRARALVDARRGDYRALYIVDDRARIVTVLAVARRRDAYRPR
jgi:mRNA-degrading endonuclease RelE of RelBE toxin-antitoxin system